ncbi:MAG TPA: VanZ family protein [Steroidobacteraceae bacterium]|nr:VanZ family protein [Steroidobacteraceae bacterium]
MLLALRHPRLWLVSGWIMVAVALIASIVPISELPKMGGISDKVEHVVAYLVLALWFAGIYPKSRYPMIGVALLVMGIVIEGLQGAMNLGRQADLRDVYANTIGIVAGLLLASIWLGGWAQRVEAWTKKS